MVSHDEEVMNFEINTSLGTNLNLRVICSRRCIAFIPHFPSIIRNRTAIIGYKKIKSTMFLHNGFIQILYYLGKGCDFEEDFPNIQQ